MRSAALRDRSALTSSVVVSVAATSSFKTASSHVTASDRAGHLKNQSGTLAADHVHFGGRHLTGGIEMTEPRATVVMRDVVLDRVYGSLLTNHDESLQTGR